MKLKSFHFTILLALAVSLHSSDANSIPQSDPVKPDVVPDSVSQSQAIVSPAETIKQRKFPSRYNSALVQTNAAAVVAGPVRVQKFSALSPTVRRPAAVKAQTSKPQAVSTATPSLVHLSPVAGPPPPATSSPAEAGVQIKITKIQNSPPSPAFPSPPVAGIPIKITKIQNSVQSHIGSPPAPAKELIATPLPVSTNSAPCKSAGQLSTKASPSPVFERVGRPPQRTPPATASPDAVADAAGPLVATPPAPPPATASPDAVADAAGPLAATPPAPPPATASPDGVADAAGPLAATPPAPPPATASPDAVADEAGPLAATPPAPPPATASSDNANFDNNDDDNENNEESNILAFNTDDVFETRRSQARPNQVVRFNQKRRNMQNKRVQQQRRRRVQNQRKPMVNKRLQKKSSTNNKTRRSQQLKNKKRCNQGNRHSQAPTRHRYVNAQRIQGQKQWQMRRRRTGNPNKNRTVRKNNKNKQGGKQKVPKRSTIVKINVP